MTDSAPLSFPALNICARAARARSGPKIVTGVPVSAWRKDDQALRCGTCSKKFGLLRRKHHCRACGDICCRRCLGSCLVDVPEQGVDMAFTCARCVQKNMGKSAFVDDINWPFPDDLQSSKLRPSRSANSIATMAMSDCSSSSTPASPCSFARSLTPSGPSPKDSRGYEVVVSQYRNLKLHSICSLLVDYLDCIGGAIVLVQGKHLWVIGHKGLHPRVLRDPTFLCICSRALDSHSAVIVPDPADSSLTTTMADPGTFQFFGASPLFDVRESSGPALGCIVALDTRSRRATSAAKMKTTLNNLADHVMDQLAEEETILRIYAAGDFKIFASNAVDSSPESAAADSFDGFSSTSSTGVSCSPFSSMHTMRSRRSNSFACGDESFVRSANQIGDSSTCAQVDQTENKLNTPRSKKQLKSQYFVRDSRSASTLQAA
ncbi:hypothetical protein PHYBOEH_009081 [Phytophthora boehmeriae]|uniref:FYVE-type domain-containing protein n=1 Tax=Phytophthora boehmeriae TaxID=109152 RepID=A0A8T1VV32_9STRA|nr:hypothetical protein PHYBOEH_009081 [Phytophthora boehmeriae]